LGLFGKFAAKKKSSFYELLNNQCEKTLEGIKTLQEFCITGKPEIGEKVILIEQEGDMHRRILIDEINNTFITPIEREDIFELSRNIDDILDYARTTVEEIRTYNIQPNEDVKAMVEVLVNMTLTIKTAVEHLEFRKNIATEEAVKTKKLENTMEQLYRNSVARLFECEDIKYILKNREIYRHLSNAADKGDHAANIVCHIIVKNS
jgi:uncharacterized protein Yka (UPF0111/DUF47 family)